MSPTSNLLVQQGREAIGRGDLAGAERAAETRLMTDPRDIDALEIRRLIQERRGDINGAVATLRQIIGIAPDADWAHDDLVTILLKHGRMEEGEAAVRDALRADPDNPDAHNLFAALLVARNDLPAAEHHTRRALQIAGPHPGVLANLALNLLQQGRVDEADPLFRQADELEPENVATLANWSRVHEVRGELDKAQALLNRAAVAAQRTGEDVSLRRAVYLARQNKPEEALNLLNAAPKPLSGGAQLERARMLDRLGRTREAWPALVEAKATLAGEIKATYDHAAVASEFAALRAFFTRANLTRLPKSTKRTDQPQPIFILGFPRSGTTMIEQMLTSHPKVTAGGELPFVGEMPDLIERLLPGHSAFPGRLAEALTADNAHIADMLRDFYFARAARYGVIAKGAAFFTDKMPLNDVYLPLIRMAFPQAPVIRMVRHPLDVTVSMMANNLTHGFNCGYRVDTIAAHFEAMTDLTAHYGRELDDMGITLRYEDFVSRQEDQTRRLLDYVGLPYDPACMAFHKSRRFAPTPSYAQVTEPLNDRSIGRWKAYFAELAPVGQRLAPVIGALGY
ncbi:tetratricopeptide repeat-containing sulfotransferase family protein [Caulobacter sp. NIBR2454]|uniref:tetratricopeptide repeat-containing sulfotransferase family protein n=1 Tax=Caulobacter sp. NIBR2454 TaxID=3015996 RepID=UPI0022B75153|nr:tetratricopeptide repeat-containing sulfotransferase family protein [Caulobacter sp. NIBR2454]